MESAKIKEAIKQKLEFAEEVSVEDQVDWLSKASIAGHRAFVSGGVLEDNPHVTEEDTYLREAWDDGWKGAFDSMVLSSVVVVARKLTEAKSPEEVDFYFDGLTQACDSLNENVYNEFDGFLTECEAEEEAEDTFLDEE